MFHLTAFLFDLTQVRVKHSPVSAAPSTTTASRQLHVMAGKRLGPVLVPQTRSDVPLLQRCDDGNDPPATAGRIKSHVAHRRKLKPV